MSKRRMKLIRRREEECLRRALEKLESSSSEIRKLEAAQVAHTRNHQFLLSYGELSLGSPEGDRVFERSLRSIRTTAAARSRLDALRGEAVLLHQSHMHEYRAGRTRVERLSELLRAERRRISTAREILDLESE